MDNRLHSSVYLQTKFRRLTGEIVYSGSFSKKTGVVCIIKVRDGLKNLEAENSCTGQYQIVYTV